MRGNFNDFISERFYTDAKFAAGVFVADVDDNVDIFTTPFQTKAFRGCLEVIASSSHNYTLKISLIFYLLIHLNWNNLISFSCSWQKLIRIVRLANTLKCEKFHLVISLKDFRNFILLWKFSLETAWIYFLSIAVCGVFYSKGSKYIINQWRNTYIYIFS